MGFKFNPFSGKFDIDTDTVAAGTATSATISVYSNATAVVASISSLDFDSFFTVTSATTGRANIGFNQGSVDHNVLLNYTSTEHFLISQISITSSQISDLTETVEDIVSGEITAGSDKITVSYNDTDGTLAIDVDQTKIDHNSLLNFTTTQHFTLSQISITSAQISDLTETVEDIVAGELTAGSSKVTGTYNDTDGTYSIDVVESNINHDALLNFTTTEHFTLSQISITASQISDLTETVEDIGAEWLTVGSAKLAGTYNDTDGTYTLDVGTINLDDLADVSISSAASGQVLMYSTTGWVNASITTSGGADTETVQDIVGAMLTATSGISFSYNDTAGTGSFLSVPSEIDHNQLLNYTTTHHFTLAEISITSAQISDLTETVEDIVAGELTVGSSKVTGTYNDADGTYSIDIVESNINHDALLNYTTTQHFTIAQISITASQVSDFTETAQDSVFNFITVGAGLSYNYTDSANFFNLSTTAIMGPLSSTANGIAYFNTTTGNTLAASSVVMATTTGIYIQTTTAKLFFATTTVNIARTGTTQLDLDSPTIRINPTNPGTTEFGDGTLRVVRPNTDGAIDLGDSTHSYNTQYTRFHFLRAGTSSGHITRVGGTIHTNTTTVGNVGTGEDDLMTFSVIANVLSTNGMYIKFRAAGTVANTANAKRLRVKFGATTMFDTGAGGIPTSAAADWFVEGLIIRTGSATQKAIVWGRLGTTVFAPDYTTPAETLTGAVTLKLTGEATSNNDVVQEIMIVEYGAYS